MYKDIANKKRNDLILPLKISILLAQGHVYEKKYYGDDREVVGIKIRTPRRQWVSVNDGLG